MGNFHKCCLGGRAVSIPAGDFQVICNTDKEVQMCLILKAPIWIIQDYKGYCQKNSNGVEDYITCCVCTRNPTCAWIYSYHCDINKCNSYHWDINKCNSYHWDINKCNSYHWDINKCNSYHWDINKCNSYHWDINKCNSYHWDINKCNSYHWDINKCNSYHWDINKCNSYHWDINKCNSYHWDINKCNSYHWDINKCNSYHWDINKCNSYHWDINKCNSYHWDINKCNSYHWDINKCNSYNIDKPFKEVYSNLNASETITLKDNITSQIESVYKKRYTNFRRHIIRKFSNGSIVTDGALEFNASNSNPNVSELAKVLVDAITAGNLTIQIKNDSINVTAPATAAATTATPSTTFNTSQINVTFSITDNFTDALSNLSSPEAIKLAHNITTQFVTVFKRRYANMLRMVIRKFSKGSIVTDGALEFINNGTVPKAQEVVNFIVEAVKNGSFTVPIDEKTVTATDSSGVQATPSPPNGSSPVISSMFTVLWMALASLLLSGVMHQ
ncbi:putative cell wall protein DAN4 [Triplophysa rosa]|uniref:Cell wall protein DAN4 n=1 Tax=Triplophysa rosa TaxID=992332 RepID=A0A9W7WYU1_TRIRA|nr:putative cell wall protein DAN4 [Triplophysa rosa]